MSEGVKVGVAIMPAPSSGAWLVALARAAKQAGWQAYKASKATDAEDAPAIVIFKEPHEIALHPSIERWVVIGSADPEAALAGSLGRNPDTRHAIQSATAALALREMVAPSAEVIIDSEDDRLVIEGLGEIHLEDSAIDARPKPASPPPAALAAIALLKPPLGSCEGVWGPEIMSFTRGQDPEGGSPEIDLTGRTRILVHGPNLTLPGGAWECAVRLSVMPDDEVKLMFEWGSGDDVHRAHTVMTEPGDYEVTLDHSWLEPRPAELRIWAERGHFSGALRFHEARVRKVSANGT